MNENIAAPAEPLWSTAHDVFEPGGRLFRCGCDECYEISRQRLAAWSARQAALRADEANGEG